MDFFPLPTRVPSFFIFQGRDRKELRAKKRKEKASKPHGGRKKDK